MNVLFYLFQNIDEASGSIGGIERHTLTLKKGLEHYGFKFFLAFSNHDEVSELDYDKSLLINSKTPISLIRDFIVKNKIDVIHVQQNDGSEMRIFNKAIEGLDHVRIVTTYHFCPGYELDDLTFHNAWVRFLQSHRLSHKIKWLRRFCLIPFYRYKKRTKMIAKFKLLYGYSKPLILLCDDYVERFSSFLSQDCRLNTMVINNCTSFDDYYDPLRLDQKKKEVVIVSRLEETYKRLSIAINIWKRFQNEGIFQDWHLTIVGEGYSQRYYESLIKNIPNITMVGRQESKPYFERSSIYLNTSKTEGWCLCCGEAMQMGVVPVSFSSWGAVYDIIDSDVNGFIIPDNDLETYYQKLVLLMSDDKLRHKMARAAIEKSQKFSKEKFLQQYIDVYSGKLH